MKDINTKSELAFLEDSRKKRLKNKIILPQNIETSDRNEDYYNLESLTQNAPKDQKRKNVKLYIKEINNELETQKEILAIIKDRLFHYESNLANLENEENNILLERLSFLSSQLFLLNEDILQSKNEELVKNKKRILDLEHENKKYKEIIYELTKQIKPQREAERVLKDLKRDIGYPDDGL